jgi:hypothetical protein
MLHYRPFVLNADADMTRDGVSEEVSSGERNVTSRLAMHPT